MKIPHSKFCVLPWISLEASPIGTVRPCCLTEHEVVDDQGVKITLGDTALADIRNTAHMRQLRQQFLNGEKPDTCRRCWREEDAGRTSKRMHTLERLKHMVPYDTWDHEAKPLMFLDLKLGNICNLKCRICGSWSSSSYAAEEIAHQPDKKNNFHYAMIKLGRWPREQPSFWLELQQHFEHLCYLEFTGGEPFMIEEHFALLRQLVQTGHAKHIDIHYNTNATLFPLGAEQIWSHFRHVEIAFSIDDVADRFEYQRAGASWLEVQANIDLFFDMRQRLSNLSLQCCSTVNVFNVMYLEDLAAWIDQRRFDFVYWNMLHDAPQFCVANLPPAAKQLARERLQSAHFSDNHRGEIDRIIAFMDQGTENLSRELCDSIRQVDKRRSQDLRIVAPALADSIDYD